MAEWAKKTLGELSKKVGMGPFGSSIKVSTFVDRGVPVISGIHLKGNKLEESEYNYISEEHAERLKSANVFAGDVVFTHAGNIKNVAYIPENANFDRYVVSQRQFFARLDTEKVLPEFVVYFFKTHIGQHALTANSSSVGVPSIAQPVTYIKTVELPVPLLDEQRLIVDQILALEDKIELNRQTNQTLEQIAQTLFKSWFVDFDPVIDNALDAGNEVPEELQARAEVRRLLRESGEFEGLPEETRRLFPDRFVWSEELGWVPEGWGVKPVAELLDINPKVVLKKGVYAQYLDMKAVPTSGYIPGPTIRKEYAGGAKFKKNDVLLARITPCLENGKTGLASFLEEEEVGFGSTEFIVLRGHGSIGYPFVSCLSRNNKFRDHCIQNMVGSSGRQRVQLDCFSDFFLAVPRDDCVIVLFDSIIGPMFERMVDSQSETSRLVAVRDTSLPKLISGEVRVGSVRIV